MSRESHVKFFGGQNIVETYGTVAESRREGGGWGFKPSPPSPSMIIFIAESYAIYIDSCDL